MSDENVADAFTKAFSGPRHGYLKSRLGVRPSQGPNSSVKKHVQFGDKEPRAKSEVGSKALKWLRPPLRCPTRSCRGAGCSRGEDAPAGVSEQALGSLGEPRLVRSAAESRPRHRWSVHCVA
eukprot:16429496-Heterocapsa_arctica.AAC.1